MDIITFLLSTIGSIFTLFGYIFTDIQIIIGIILNPWLFLMIILTLCNFYSAISAKSRLELITGYFRGISIAAQAIFSTIRAIIPILIGGTQMLVQILQGILQAPPVTIVGTGIGVGTIVAAGLILVIAGSLFGSMVDVDLVAWINALIADVQNWF